MIYIVTEKVEQVNDKLFIDTYKSNTMCDEWNYGEWWRNNSVKWSRFIVPRNVEQINDYLFIDTCKSNNIQIGVNDSEMCVRWKDRRYQSWDSLGEYRLRGKGRVKEMGF